MNRERERTESKDWIGNQNSIYTTLGASNHTDKERQQHDYYATEPKAMELLLAEEQFSPVIWEPACGEGHISKVLQAHGSVLPNSLKTEVVMTANIREWRHFLKLRCSPAAHPQMREVALILLEKVHALIPVCFDDIWEEYHEQG